MTSICRNVRHVVAVLFAVLLASTSLQAQTRETLQFSFDAYEALLNNLKPGQDTIAIGDMLMDVSEAREIRDKLRARLDGKLTAQGAFDFTSNKAWPNGVIPYAYDKSMPDDVRVLFETAIREWQEHASLNFVTRTTQANYLLIKFTGYTNDAPMNSFIGMRGKVQDLNVAGWGNKIDCAHELGHALGMTHEQCRSDRDRFVTFFPTNLTVDPSVNVNYAIVPGSINRTDYDFDSLMHYPRGAFARNGSFPTMLAKSPNEKWSDGIGPEEIGQKTHLSAGDKAAMSAQYGAPLTIGGRIVDAAGNPLTGVQVTLSGGAAYRGKNPISTDAEGKYSFTGIPRNSGTYTVAVSQPSVSFTENSRLASVDVLSHTQINFTSIDSAPPDLHIDVPTISGVYASTPEASGRANDSVALKEVRVALARTSDLVWWNWNENTWGTTTFDWSKNVRIATGKTTWRAALPNLPVGGYQLHVQSVDSSDNASPWKFRHFFVDPEPPVVAVMQPLPGSSVNEFKQLRGTATDGAGTGVKDDKVYFTIYQNGDFWTGFNWKRNTTAQDPDVLLSADVVAGQWVYNSVPGGDHHAGGGDLSMRHGKHYVSVFARDNAGNLSQPTPGMNSVEFTVDHSPPSISIVSPANGSTVSNLVSISGTASDSGSLATVRLYIYRYSDGQFWDGTAWGGGGSAILPVTIDPTKGTWTSSGVLPSIHSRNPATRLSNGGYNIVAFAVDSAGNQTRSDVVVTVEYYPQVTYTAGSYRDDNPHNNNDLWDNPANWDLGFVPGREEIAIINSGSPLFSGDKVVHALRMSGGDLRGGRIVIPRDGLMTWTGGTLSADLTVEEFGRLALSGAGDRHIASGRRVINHGEVSSEGAARIHGSGATVFLNHGTFNADGDLTFVYYNNGVYPVGQFENHGTLTKTGEGTLRFTADYGGWVFTNAASLQIEGGLVAVHNNTHLGGTISGAGRLFAEAATLHLNSTTTLDGGTVELKSGRLVGTGTFGGTGSFVWSGGSLEGDFTVGQNTRAIFNGGDRTLASGARLRNLGTLTWESGALHTSGQSRLENSGRIDISGNVAAVYYNNGVFPRGEFLNTGLLTVNGGATVRFTPDYGGLHYSSRGETRVVNGTLILGGGGFNTNAVFDIQNGLVELVPGERHHFGGRIDVKGAGTMRVNGATLTGNNAALSVASGATYEHANGTAEGTFALAGPGTFVWSGGTLNAVLDLAADLQTRVSGDAEKNLEAGRITHRGNLVWTGAGALRAVGQAEFRNEGLFEARNSSAFIYYNNGVFPRGRFGNFGTFRKTVDAGAIRFLPEYGGWDFSNRGTLDVQTGALELNVATTFENGGQFTGAGTVRLVGASANFVGTNHLSGGNFELANGTVSSENGLVQGTGTVLWTGGTIAGVVNIDATDFQLRGPADKVIASSSTLRNRGRASWAGTGPLRFTGQTFLENSGRFELLEDTTLFYYNNGVFPRGAFINSGTFVKSGGTNSATFANDYGGALFDNTGTVAIERGALHLGGGGSWQNGNIVTAPGSDLRLFSGPFRLSGFNRFDGLVTLAGAEMNMLESTNSLSTGAKLRFTQGGLIGSGVFSGPGNFEWAGGTIAGSFTISPETSWTLDGDAEKHFPTGTIENLGTGVWRGAGAFKAEGAALLNNRGTFTLQSDAAFTYYNNGVFPRGRFHNTGTLRKSGASGISAFSPDYGGWEFSNAGVIHIDSGVLSLRTENRFTNAVIRGAGRVRVDNGALALSGTTALDGGTLEVASGHVSGESAFAGATGLFEWSGGELRGEHTVRSGARLRLSGSAEKLVAGSSALINDGTVTWTGTGQIRGVGQSRIVNNATFEILNDSSFGYYNNGVFPVGSFQNNGTILKQSSGRSSFLHDYGGWHFRNNGTIDARAGIFDFGPNFEETASSQIALAMSGAAPSEYASIAFGAPPSLKGSFRLQLAAEHLPAPGTVYTLATYPRRTGEFVSPALPALPAGRTWKIEYLADRMNLSVQEVTTALNSALSRSADGQFQLTVTGSPGQYALFQVTTNLLDWTTLATNRPFAGHVQFQDPSATNRWKFYRTVIVP